MRSLRNYSELKASSVLESVIALSILSICILVASSIYVNVVNQKRSIGYYNAMHEIERLTESIIMTKDYSDDSYEKDGFKILKEIEVNEPEKTAVIRYAIIASGKKEIHYKVIPYENNEQD